MRILITGVSGLLGSNLAYCYQGKHELLGLYGQHPWQRQDIKTVAVDLGNPQGLKRIFDDFRPAVVIHCAALANVDVCEQQRETAYQVNVLGTRHVVDAIQGKNIRLSYISSDAIYDGQKGFFGEEDPVHPINYYGQVKYKGEIEAIRQVNTLIVRTAFFGWNIQPKCCFPERVIQDLSAGKKIKGFTDIVTSALYTFDLADLLEAALHKGLQGVYHFGTRTAVSKYDFALLIARQLGFDASLIESASVEGSALTAKRGKNLSLNVQKLTTALGRKMPSMEETIEKFCADYRKRVPEILKK